MKKPQPKKRKGPESRPRSTRKKSVVAPSFPKISIRKILIPIDFSQHSKKALSYAASFAKQFGAMLHIIYVVEPVIYPSDFAIGQLTFPNIENEMREKAELEMENLLKNSTIKGFRLKKIVKDGIPFVEVTAYAQEEKIDLIILATHGHTGVEHILFGSTAEKIVRKAPCPVLVVRSEEHDFIDERV